MKKIFTITLGCAKNRVDTEYVLADLEKSGFVKTDDPDEADILCVNTCAFIEDSKIESIDTILELASIKKTGQKLAVLGCLPQRYGDDLAESLPEADIFIGTSKLNEFSSVLKKGKGREYSSGGGSWVPDNFIARESSLSAVSAYLKIAEGCNRKCAFCAVPGIRGRQQSFSPDILKKEAEHFISGGIKEINLIAQDLTAYGKDIGTNLIELLRMLDTIDFEGWYRLLYLYPTEVTVDLLNYIKDSPHIVPYIDIPVQHVSSSVLKTMRRGYDEKRVRDMVSDFRKVFGNEIFLRTTLITGHPGETEADFSLLKQFVAEAEFDHLGVFAYSPEEDTAAYEMDSVSRETAKQRRNEIMSIQKEISAERLQNSIGKVFPVLVEEFDEGSMVWIGRHYGQAPEVDGDVFLTQTETEIGSILNVKMVETSDYDYVGYGI